MKFTRHYRPAYLLQNEGLEEDRTTRIGLPLTCFDTVHLVGGEPLPILAGDVLVVVGEGVTRVTVELHHRPVVVALARPRVADVVSVTHHGR